MKEFVVAGLLISPFVKYLLIAALLYLPIRLVLIALRFDKWVWHPMLAETAIYLCLVAVLNILV